MGGEEGVAAALAEGDLDAGAADGGASSIEGRVEPSDGGPEEKSGETKQKQNPGRQDRMELQPRMEGDLLPSIRMPR